MAARYQKVGEPISRGRFGDFYKCLDTRDNSDCVVKVIPYEQNEKGVPSSIIGEICVLKELSHRYAVRLLDMYDDVGVVYLIFEPMELDLKNLMYGPRVTELKPDVIKSFLFQILDAVKYCHSLRIMHRDLKPKHLLVDTKSRIIKIADFGFTRTFDVPLPQPYSIEVRAHSHQAPELLLDIPYSKAVDIWSVGCIFVEMVGKCVLFKGKKDKVIMNSIMSVFGKPDETDWPGVTKALAKLYGTEDRIPNPPALSIKACVPKLDSLGIDLLSKMLCVNPKGRITAYDALKHPYFDNVQM